MDKQKIIITLLVINIIVVSFFGITINNQVLEHNQQLQSEINNLRGAINNIDSNLEYTIESTLEQNRNRIDDIQYSYKSIDAAKDKAVITYTVLLKSVSANSKVYLAYSPDNSAKVTEVELNKTAGVAYQGDVELSLDYNYEYDIVERSDDGAETLLNVHKQRQPLHDEFYTNRVLVVSRGSGKSDTTYGEDFAFSVSDFGISDYALESIKLEVSYEGQIIHQQDITLDLIDAADTKAIEEFNASIASGEQSKIPEYEYKEIMEQADRSSVTYFYSYNLFYSDYPNLNLSFNSEDLLSKLIFTFKDGYTREILSDEH